MQKQGPENWNHSDHLNWEQEQAIEYKKIFMDERTGEIHKEHFDIVKNDFLRTRDQIMDML
jgi:hypothetical protein